MSLIQQIKDAQLACRKLSRSELHKEKATLLTTLIGEAEMIGKNDGNRETTDAEVTTVIKKFIKNINETIKAMDGIAPPETLLRELETLNGYLPSQMSDDELRTAITSIVTAKDLSDMKDMGKVMKSLKEEFDGQYDGKSASSIVREVLGK